MNNVTGTLYANSVWCCSLIVMSKLSGLVGGDEKFYIKKSETN